MVMSLKERLANKTTSKLKGKLQSKSSGGGIRDKFKKRSQTILDKTYEDRDERSKSGSMARSIFNKELMAQYGIEDFQTTIGDRFVEVLPISFNDDIPYYKEIAVHFGVGFQNDSFICMARYQAGQRCYRCETQSKMWNDNNFTKDQAKKLYPTDRACYLLWERTKELLEGESPDYSLKLWASPKTKVHSEIQAKVRDKINRTTLDISDVSENGDGRTVGFSILKKGEWPDYKAFDLVPRDISIPSEILEQLEQLILDAEKLGFNNCIEMFFNIPKYEDIKESMETEDMDNKEQPDETTSKKSFKRSLLQSNQNDDTKTNPIDPVVVEKEIMAALEEVQTELETISKSKFKWIKWCKENNYEDALEMDIVEAIPAIIDDMYEKEIANSDIPF